MSRDTDGYGKTDDRRPCLVSDEEIDLRWKLAYLAMPEQDRFETKQRIKALVAERTFYGKAGQ